MGVWHFIPLGRSPGAATAPLAYIKRRFEQNDFNFFGRSSNRETVKKISGIVIFTTPEIRKGTLKAHDNENYIGNPYNIDKGQSFPLGDSKGYIQTFKVVCDFIKKEFSKMLAEERGKVYYCQASYDNLDENINCLAQTFYALSPPNGTGREVWVNLTGSSNVVNIATWLITTISGITGRAYYTSTDNIKLLRPASESNFWIDIPVLKVYFDRDYEVILRMLQTSEAWMNYVDLLERVKNKNCLPNTKPDTFRSNYLNKLDGWLIERRGESDNRLAKAGERFLQLLDNPVIRALIYKEPLADPIKLSDILEEVF